eukprot:7086009-Pyramimonas_sp.AAC.1
MGFFSKIQAIIYSSCVHGQVQERILFSAHAPCRARYRADAAARAHPALCPALAARANVSPVRRRGMWTLKPLSAPIGGSLHAP